MQTVLSAALSEHPNRRITLLLDDPPTGKAADLIGLDAARALVFELDDLFRRASQQFRIAAGDHNARFMSDSSFFENERVILAGFTKKPRIS